jgi:hypothetical protein
MTTGELKRLIEEDGLRYDLNPAISKATSDSNLYDDILHSLAGKTYPIAKFEGLAIRDIQDASTAAGVRRKQRRMDLPPEVSPHISLVTLRARLRKPAACTKQSVVRT